MAGLFSGLELGKKALATNQLWLNTIGHNISNVNTPGYTRQRVDISTTLPEPSTAGPVGTGVTATDIRNVRDLFLNQQYRYEMKNLGQWETMEKTLTQIEATFSEPNSDSLGELLDKFWTGWMDLSNHPESTAARTALFEQANLLTAGFHRLYSRFEDLRESVDTDIALTVNKVNQMATEITALNKQIVRDEAGGDHANDLRDRRDYLIDLLSQYVDVNTADRKNGAVAVQIGSLTIADESTVTLLGTKEIVRDGVRINKVVWAGTDKEIRSLNGELKGLVETRDKMIPGYMDNLDELARSVVTEVNNLHRNGIGLDGSTGLNFFTEPFVSAGKIEVSFMIKNDVTRIAASLSGEVGDNTNALAIAELRTSLIMTNGSATMGDFYNSIISRVGVETQKATQLREDHQLLVEQVENSRQSVQGVSLDEEMANMIKYQHAFDAAARVITTIDQALEVVISGMGIVGR